MRRDGPDCRIVILAVYSIIRLLLFYFFCSRSWSGYVRYDDSSSSLPAIPFRAGIHFSTSSSLLRFFLPLLLLSSFDLQASVHSYLLILPFLVLTPFPPIHHLTISPSSVYPFSIILSLYPSLLSLFLSNTSPFTPRLVTPSQSLPLLILECLTDQNRPIPHLPT